MPNLPQLFVEDAERIAKTFDFDHGYFLAAAEKTIPLRMYEGKLASTFNEKPLWRLILILASVTRKFDLNFLDSKSLTDESFFAACKKKFAPLLQHYNELLQTTKQISHVHNEFIATFCKDHDNNMLTKVLKNNDYWLNEKEGQFVDLKSMPATLARIFCLTHNSSIVRKDMADFAKTQQGNLLQYKKNLQDRLYDINRRLHFIYDSLQAFTPFKEKTPCESLVQWSEKTCNAINQLSGYLTEVASDENITFEKLANLRQTILNLEHFILDFLEHVDQHADDFNIQLVKASTSLSEEVEKFNKRMQASPLLETNSEAIKCLQDAADLTHKITELQQAELPLSKKIIEYAVAVNKAHQQIARFRNFIVSNSANKFIETYEALKRLTHFSFSLQEPTTYLVESKIVALLYNFTSEEIISNFTLTTLQNRVAGACQTYASFFADDTQLIQSCKGLNQELQGLTLS